jgi:CspA family cold shock protein
VPTGKVKRFNDAKGYGFIGIDGSEDIFVHYTGITGHGHRSLAEGAHVEFDIDYDGKRPRAINVVVIEQLDADALPYDDTRGLNGTITGWIGDKGYGFIEQDDGGNNVFIHINDLYERPDGGADIDLRDTRVAFDVAPDPGKKKDHAVNVVRIIGSSSLKSGRRLSINDYPYNVEGPHPWRHC